MMNLKDILASKTKAERSGATALKPPSPTILPTIPTEELTEIESRSSINDFIFTAEKENNEKALECFLILYYKAHARDVYIRHGEGAALLYEFLGLPTAPLPTSSIPLGHNIKDQYVICNILGLNPHTVYSIMNEVANKKK